jgi:GMP synthase-like glutamine amidotransferase
MQKKKLLVLQHIACEGLGSLENFFKEKGMGFDYRQLSDGDRVPENLENYCAWILLGGPMNVYEEEKYPFLRQEDKLLKEACKKDFPTLGICLGAQLIAKNLQASVTKGKQKEIGWYKIDLTEDGKKDPLFQNLSDQFLVFQWHGDTFEIPDKGSYLAQSNFFQHQAFRFNQKIYGLQFHIEVTQDMIQDWVRTYTEEKIDSEKILGESEKFMNDLKKTSRQIYENLWRIWDLS